MPDKPILYLEDYLQTLIEACRSGQPLPDLKPLADLLGGYKSSGLKVSSNLIKTGAGYFGGVIILTDGTNAGTVTVYDNKNELSDKVIWAVAVGANLCRETFPLKPIRFSNGCNAELSGSGASYIVYFI